MVKNHSDCKRGNPLLPHGLLLPFSSKGYFICTIPDRIAHTTAFVNTSRGALTGITDVGRSSIIPNQVKI